MSSPGYSYLYDATLDRGIEFRGLGGILFVGNHWYNTDTLTWEPVTADESSGGSGESVTVTNFPAIQAISATSLPLPTGAATEATLLGVLKPGDSVDVGNFPSSFDVGNFPGIQVVSGEVGVIPDIAGGFDVFHLVSAATTNPTVVKASPGQLYGWYLYNASAAPKKLAFHDDASPPTAGASIKFSVMVPPFSAANISFTVGIPFSAGIGITTVAGIADTDASSVALNDLLINLWYK